MSLTNTHIAACIVFVGSFCQIPLGLAEESDQMQQDSLSKTQTETQFSEEKASSYRNDKKERNYQKRSYSQSRCNPCCPSDLAYYLCGNKGYFFMEGGPVVWTASESGLDYAIENKGNTGFISNGSAKSPDWEWDVGGKLGIGWQSKCRRMDVFLNWTYFRTTQKSSVTAPDDGAVYPLWTVPISGLTHASSGNAKWKLWVNLVDLEGGGKFTPRPWLMIRPSIGVRNALVYQKYNINMFGASSIGPVVPVEIDETKMDNDFWGIGPKFGLQTLWGSLNGFSLFGNAAFSILYGRFDVTQKEVVTFEGVSPPSNFLNYKHKFTLASSIFDLFLGFRYDKMFAGKRGHMAILAGWETIFFFGQNQFRVFSSEGNPGVSTPLDHDLTTQGATFLVNFGF